MRKSFIEDDNIQAKKWSLSTVDFKKVGKSFKNVEFGSTTTSLKERKESDEEKEERSSKIPSKED